MTSPNAPATAAMTVSAWAKEFSNQRLKPFEMRTLALVAAIGPVSSERLAEINGRTNINNAREWKALLALEETGLIILTPYGWCVATMAADEREGGSR